MFNTSVTRVPYPPEGSVETLEPPVPQPRRRRKNQSSEKMVSEADNETTYNGAIGERSHGSKIEIRITSGDNSYKPLINSPSTDTMGPCPDTDDLELTNLEDAKLLELTEDGETTETTTPECSVSIAEVEETACTIAWQVAIPFLIAGLGMVGAGLVLDIVQHWKVFLEVSEVFILVPALLGLKGNLEMTLASRLSTQANLGHMDTRSEMWQMIFGNLSLIQCQATVVGFLASMAAVIMGWIPAGKFELKHALLLCASSLVTASVASFVLGVIMVGVVVLSRKCNINPDNVATPIAASLGDLTTLSLLASISSALYSGLDSNVWLSPTIVCISLLLTPIWVLISKRNPYTKKVLYTGWTPVISAMGISSLGGLILDMTVSRFRGIAVFQPVINGVGGNLVAVHASRISTSLHQTSELGHLPLHVNRLCMDPFKSFFGKDTHAKTSRVLMLLVVPGHLIFTYTIYYVKAGHTSLTLVFVCVYLFAAVLQVAILLYIGRILIHWMWTREIDPDNSAIPYLTALGDLLGTALLAVAFCFLYLIGDKDSDVGD